MVNLNFLYIIPRVITFRFRKMRVISGLFWRLVVYQYRFCFTKLFIQNSSYSVRKSPPLIDGSYRLLFQKTSIQHKDIV
jgi:hypothetical protein